MPESASSESHPRSDICSPLEAALGSDPGLFSSELSCLMPLLLCGACLFTHRLYTFLKRRALSLLLDAPTALAACCGFDLCHKYILYLYLYLSLSGEISSAAWPTVSKAVARCHTAGATRKMTGSASYL